MKNTIMLYLRMLVLMLISFYTSRVVLNALGVDNYGVYNVVGGIVAMLGFVTSSMVQASNRFLAFAIGKKDIDLLNRTYSTTSLILFSFSMLLVVLAETVGLWYFYHYIEIPSNSRVAAMWVYQLSIAASVIGINSVPVMSLIVAHEDMSAYAYVSLVEGGLKLGVAFLLLVPVLANLKAYAIMIFLVGVIIRLIWFLYSRHKYPYVKLKYSVDKALLKDLFGFMSWQVISSLSWLLRNQGVNLVLNNFFGPALNAARSLALQVNSGITSLANNFTMATNPQLVKYFASDEIEGMQRLLFRSSKMIFFLLFIFAFPVYIVAPKILSFWLGEVPPYTLVFVQLIIIATLLDALSGTLQQTVAATGQVAKYTKVSTPIMLSNIVLVIIAFKLGMPPTAMIYVDMMLYVIVLFARLLVSKQIYQLSISSFLKNVTLREFVVTAFCAILYILYIPFGISQHIPFVAEGLIFFVIAISSIAIFGLSVQERQFVSSLLINRILKFKSHGR